MKNKILVIGGTGMLGSHVVKELKENNTNYVVLVRTAEKGAALENADVPIVMGTLDKIATIDAAMQDIDTLYLLTSPAFNMLELHKAAIDSAVKNGVKKIVRASGEPANYADGLFMYEQHKLADEYLKNCGLEHVSIRPHTFIQSLMFMHAEYIKTQNSFAQYLGDAKIPFIDVRDIAKVAFIALTTEQLNNQVITLTGPEAISFGDIAEMMSETLGRPIHYHSLSYKEQESGFKRFGLPDWQVESILKVFKVWVDRGISDPTRDFETITSYKATSVKRFIKDHISVFQ